MKTGDFRPICISLPKWRAIVVALAFAGFLPIQSSNLFAQQRGVLRTSHSRERTKEFIDDYSISVGTENEFERPSLNDRRNPAGHGQIDPKAVKPLLRAFADSLAQLTYDLNEQTDKTPGLRQIYTEALRLSGAAVAINKRAEKYGIDGAMVDDVQQLDANWHDFAHRLENTRGLSADSRNLIADINDADQRIRQLIGISVQLDRRQLNLKAAALVAALENLQEDITSELGNNRESQFYRRSISRARQVVVNLVALLRDDRSDSATIVEEYNQFETIWTQIVAKLRTEDDRYIERGVRRVATSASGIEQLLLLPQKVDQSQSIYYAKALKKDIDEFFERTPLILVMQLPNSKQALPVADQFYGACSRFVETVNRSEDQAEIMESFRKIEQAERAFTEVYRDVDSDRAVAVLTRINQTSNSLRSALQIQRDDFDSQSVADLAASIQNFTEQIAGVSRRWLESDNQPFAADCLHEANDLADTAARLHDDLVDGRRPSEVKEAMNEVYEKWRRVYGYLVKCQTDDRPTLGRLSTALTPKIVDLRAIIMQ